MTPARFQTIAARYARLKLALVGDFCLDRYLEIDPARAEISIETGLPVHNVVRVRAQPGGDIVNDALAVHARGQDIDPRIDIECEPRHLQRVVRS